MKKTGFLLLALCSISTGLWSFPARGVDASWETRLSLHVQETACPLYSSYLHQLETYYQRTDFTDPNRQTGWYRVQDFLNWLKDAEPELQKTKINRWIDKSPLCEELKYASDGESSSQKRVSVYLGTRYALARLGLKVTPDAVSLFVHPYLAGAKEGVLFMPDNVPYNMVNFLNLGIHETAHLLPAFVSPGSKQTLGESAAVYTQTNFALPFKPVQGVSYSHGVRHLLVTLQNEQASTRMLYEYNAFLAGILPGSHSKQEDLFNYSSHVGWERGMAEVVFHITLLRQGKLLFDAGGTLYAPSEEEYLKALVSPAINHKPLIKFYKNWLKAINLPQDEPLFAGTVILPAPGFERQEETQTLMERQQALDAFAAKYELVLQKTLFKTLKKSGIKAPPVPQGYI